MREIGLAFEDLVHDGMAHKFSSNVIGQRQNPFPDSGQTLEDDLRNSLRGFVANLRNEGLATAALNHSDENGTAGSTNNEVHFPVAETGLILDDCRSFRDTDPVVNLAAPLVDQGASLVAFDALP